MSRRDEETPKSWLQIWLPPVAILLAAWACLYETGVLADTPAGEQPSNWHEVVPKNLCPAGQGAGPRGPLTIFRGARPDENGLRFLQSQGIDHVVNLETQDQIADESNLVEQLGLGIKELPHPMNDGMGVNKLTDGQVDDDSIIAAVAEMRKPENLPLYVHCHFGDDRTGMVVAFHRVFNECWTPKDAEGEWNHIEGWWHHLFQLPKHHYFHKVMKNSDLHQYYEDQLQRLAPAAGAAPQSGAASSDTGHDGPLQPMQEPGGVVGNH